MCVCVCVCVCVRACMRACVCVCVCVPLNLHGTRYYTRESATNAMVCVNGTKLDDRLIRTDWDPGFVEGRQFGRGRSGGQVREGWERHSYSWHNLHLMLSH